jgi:omega-6 fatty acid desaturase (delta-12 desaturase)
MTGASGGPKYGVSNHFLPTKPFDTELWPGKWPTKVWQSDIGIVAMLGLVGACAAKFGLASVAALYLAPLTVTNMWLVGYTWLQHTDVDVPHLSGNEHDYMRGAFLTIDRPYGRLLDYLHHRIGSTHVAHHIDCTIPHYYAKEATDAIAKAFPKAYLYDPTPIHEALWRVASNCSAVQLRPHDGRYTWVPAS